MTPVDPDQEQLAELGRLAAESDDPVVMLNLNKYRDRSAYERYGEAALPTLEKVGGRVLWHAEPKATLIGDGSDVYDEVIAVWYPSASAFVQFATDAAIVAALPQRTQALERAALICCPQPVEGPPAP